MSLTLREPGFIILACDGLTFSSLISLLSISLSLLLGLWDVMSCDKATKIAAQLLRDQRPLREVAETLVRRAVKRGSLDNVSVVVFLAAPE